MEKSCPNVSSVFLRRHADRSMNCRSTIVLGKTLEMTHVGNGLKNVTDL